MVQALRRNRQGAVSPALVSAAEEAIAMGQALVTPAAIYDEFLVCEVSDERVNLSARLPFEEAAGTRNGCLKVGPKVDLLAPASLAVIAVCTIGPLLENRARELHEIGQDLLAFMLDSFGVMALGAVGEALRCMVEEQASASGWGVGPALSPGSLVGWPVQGQRDLCALLPLDKIGVRLNDQCVLEPHKSSSMVIGLGPNYPSSHVGSVCSYCSLAGSCWRRREDAA
jgi:hypothetical protein